MAYNPLKNLNLEDLEVSDTYEVRFLPIADLKDSKENAERSADFKSRPEDVESFKEQLEKLGLLDPLHVVDVGNGKYKIISGHYRKYCLEQLFKEGRSVSYKGRVLNNEVPCIIDEITDDTEMIMALVAANSRNNSVDEKIYRTKMAVDLHRKLLKKGVEVSANRNDFVAMITGFSKRSVQSYINQVEAKTAETAKAVEAEAFGFDLIKTTKKAKAFAAIIDKEMDDEDKLHEKLKSYTDTELIRFIDEISGVIESLKSICVYTENAVARKQRG